MNNIFDNPYARAATKGLTFGLSEPIGAALASGMSYLAPQGGRPMSFQEAYAAEVAKREAERQKNPVGMTLSEMAGAVPTAIATSGLGMLGQTGLGGMYGGLETQSPIGTALGAAGGAGASMLSKLFTKPAQTQTSAMTPQTTNTTAAVTAQIQKLNGELGDIMTQYQKFIENPQLTDATRQNAKQLLEFQIKKYDDTINALQNKLPQQGAIKSGSAPTLLSKPSLTTQDKDNFLNVLREAQDAISYGKVATKDANKALEANEYLNYMKNLIQNVDLDNAPAEVRNRAYKILADNLNYYNKTYGSLTKLPNLSQIQQRAPMPAMRETPNIDMGEVYNRYIK